MYELLVADDSLAELDCINFLISKYQFPFHVSTASNGEEAFLLLNRQHFDLLITDIQMPFMDGLSLTKAAINLHSDIKTIIISAHEDFSYAKQAIKLGVSEYLLKPIDPVEFRSVISVILPALSDTQIKPDDVQAPDETADHPDSCSGKIKDVKQYIYEHYGSDLSLDILAEHVYVRPDYLSRLFKKETGCHFNQFIKDYRMKKAKELLQDTQMRVSSIGSMVGYPNNSYFCKVFGDYFGMSPEKFRETSFPRGSKK